MRGVEIYVIVSDSKIVGTTVPSVVWYTQSCRMDGLPKAFVTIVEAGDGALYVLDTSQVSEEECPVLLWEYGYDETEVVSDSFSSFLLEQLQESAG